MRIEIISPSKAILINPSQDDLNYLRTALTYTNTSVQHQIKRTQGNVWFKRNNPEGWQATILDLKSKLKHTLLWNDGANYWIRPGSISYLSLDGVEVTNLIKYPAFKKVAWAKPLPFQLYDYQKESWQGMLSENQANVELCTGSGKFAIILKMCREMGLNTVIVVPSKTLFNEAVEKFEYHFGKKMVGTYGAGRKKLGKKFTIAISDSLSGVEKDTEAWEFFSNLDALIVDESHGTAANELHDTCYGVLENVKRRYFLSGTQIRNNGTDILLESIIGRTVRRLSTRDALSGGFICPHRFKIVEIPVSNSFFSSNDPLETKRIHFLRNQNIANFIAKLVCAEATVNGNQSLVLVEEISQIAMLVPLLTVPYAIAHSETDKKKLADMGLEKVDSSESVDAFNSNKVKVIIGSGAVATGVNFYSNALTINWCGGSSPIRTKQGAVGRSCRLSSANPYRHLCKDKTETVIWDFKVVGEDTLDRHLAARIECYEDSGTEIKWIKLK